MKASLIEDEEMRLALLRGNNILDTAPHEGFDDITKLAAEICEVPIALISLVDDKRQWFKCNKRGEIPCCHHHRQPRSL